MNNLPAPSILSHFLKKKRTFLVGTRLIDAPVFAEAVGVN